MRAFWRGWAVRGVLTVLFVGKALWAAPWFPLGPFGGDARSLAADPANSRHLFLGTATGWVYDSHDGGQSWVRVSQIANRNDLVIDHILVDAKNPKRLIVAAWTVDRPDGGLFISEDYGKNWYSQAQMRGQSIRSLARSPSDPNDLVAGTLTGIFRSPDNGVHWTQISPAGSAEIHEVESVAIDPADPNVIYAGTWHLPWKTTDGGANWHNIKDGIIDDSDVFSIIVDPKDPSTVYASACSGIYKSLNAGELFRKVQGIPKEARRTRKLAQDPANASIVFAGTTEGLYRSLDAGSHWDRMTPGDYIVNDVYIDSANDQHVLIATDRGGLYRSDDGGTTFVPSNQGFSARQVIAYSAGSSGSNTVYVGVVNDKTTGGVFQSTDGGVKWVQRSDGLGGRDVFSLVNLPDGTILAGTAHGVFRFAGDAWQDSSALEGPSTEQKAKTVTTTVTLPAPARLAHPVTRTVVATRAKTGVPVAKTGSKPRKSPPVAAKSRAPIRKPAKPVSKPRKRPSGAPSREAWALARRGVLLPVTYLVQHPPKKTPLHAQVHKLSARTSAARPKPVAKAPSSASTGTVSDVPTPSTNPNRLDTVVYCLMSAGDVLFAGSSSGLLRSVDMGQHWSQLSSLAMPDIHFVSILEGKTGSGIAAGPMVLAANLQRLSLSPDGGATWDTLPLPSELTQIGAVAIDGEKNLWVGGREGIWYSTDYGATWKTQHNLFLTEVNSIYFDPLAQRVLVTASSSQVAFSLSLAERKVTYWDTGWRLRFVRPVGDHLIGATLFDGVVVQPRMVASPVSMLGASHEAATNDAAPESK